MFTNNFCPTCRQIADEFLDSNILNKNDKIFNQPNSTFSNPQDSRQCSGCERIFSPLEFSPLEQGQCDELPIDQRYIPDIDISCFSESSAWKNISDHLNLLMSKELDSTSTDLIRYNDNWNLVTPMRCDDNTQNNSVIDDFDFFDFLKDIPLQEYKETVDFESNGVSNLPEFDFDLLDMEEFDTISTDHMLLNENFDANLIDSIMLSDANEQNVNLNTFAVGGPSEESESSQTVAVETQSNDQQSNFPETVDSGIQESSSVQPAMILEDCNVPAIISCEDTTLKRPTRKFKIDLEAIVSDIFEKSEENELTQKTVANLSNEQNVELNTVAVSGPSEESTSSQTVNSELQVLSAVQPAMILQDCVMYVVPTFVLCEGENLNMPTSRSKIDLEANGSDIETQANAQPAQGDMASNGGQKSTIQYLPLKELNLRNEGAGNSIRKKKSCGSRNQYNGSKRRKRNENMGFIAYRLDTKQKVSVDEVEAVLNNSLTIDLSEGLSFDCKIRHKCQKKFTDVTSVSDHLFRNFFFLRCTFCRKRFKHLRNFQRHHKTCKEPTTESIGTSEPKSIDCFSSNACDPEEIQSQLETGAEFDRLLSIDENKKLLIFQHDGLTENSDLTIEKKVDSADETNSQKDVIED